MKSQNENRKIFKHFLITNFNIPFSVYSQWKQKNWLKHRFKIFDKYCYPSVRGQINQNFKWIVVFDTNTPDIFRRRINHYAEWENFIPAYISINEGINPYRQSDKFVRETISRYLTDVNEYLITTNIDNDDAISKNFISVVQNYFNQQKFLFLNFTNGYIWNYRTYEIYLAEISSGFFVTLIEKAHNFKSIRCGVSHPDFNKIGPILEIATKPVWLAGIHGKNESNTIFGKQLPPKKLKSLHKDFMFKKNFLLPYLISSFYYYSRQVLNWTRGTRSSLGLTVTQLTRFKNKIIKIININR